MPRLCWFSSINTIHIPPACDRATDLQTEFSLNSMPVSIDTSAIPYDQPDLSYHKPRLLCGPDRVKSRLVLIRPLKFSDKFHSKGELNSWAVN